MALSFSPEIRQPPFLLTTTADSTLPLLVLLTCLPSFLLAAHYIRKDYHAFLALGPGGTPSTPTGYARICILRLFTVRDPLSPPSIPPSLHPKHGQLPSSLPVRAGPRPTVAGIAPHRQTTQRASKTMYATLSNRIHELVNAHPSTLRAATSCFEKHSTGIFCVAAAAQAQAQAQRHTCDGEVCHSHPVDGSLHLTLHPADVRAVLEKGWGQRHPLAWDDGGEEWCWWRWAKSVPPGFVMIYAPRDERELEVVMDIIRAAVWWVGGTELK
ncbi:hypothetical protein IFM58399_01561 [Aspergillus lentulus]|uniref:Luciferase domain-containing protein n=1 Tax=Aspergillus lentulus TaxID=293939 RepID=A0ABQ0ZW58_ASPLE|nr:uncharacterized protein IFM58399_01561 [Aspergillus lentulus]GFF26942.1 hypothetical protein IFM58399_01561 [Aspergillus lentulus]GFF47027.1 hypothetical protein IFM62136_00660 [Aspergillus lentulus]GFF66816.1 hypothetical protein IFM60648_02051 [Aspergillus lentulus]GFG06434.1 hypothetical protein IFM61392_04339 [Aspergillus lentulus]